jgi:beta-lactamase class A
MMMDRRRMVLGSVVVMGGFVMSPRMAWGVGTGVAEFEAELARLEKESGGRLGVAVLNTGSGTVVGRRLEERFPMCSTFKLLATAAVLRRVDEGKEQLGRVVRFEKKDVVAGNSPVTKLRAGGAGMTVAELCAAAMTVSDNTAANLLVASVGGPASVTAVARGMGDAVTRLDRVEPELNSSIAGDVRDTTSPAAMARDVQKLVLGETLSVASRGKLKEWMLANKTGAMRLRAGLPADWVEGDKTGSGEKGTTNDVAVVWPAGRGAISRGAIRRGAIGNAPMVVAVYLTEAKVGDDAREAVIAGVGRAVAVMGR